MRIGRSIAAMAALALLGNAPAAARDPTAAEIESLETDTYNYRPYPQPEIVAWEAEFRSALFGSSLDRAAAAVAPHYGLTIAEMRELGRLWILGRALTLAARRDDANAAAQRGQWLALLARNRRAPLMLQMVAESLDRLNDCRGEDFAAMMAGAADPVADAWTIANRAICTDNFLRFAAAAPGRMMPALIRLADFGSLRDGDSLALYELLTSPAAIARIAEADRAELAALLYARRAKLLFRTGLTERAVAMIEGLPADTQRRVLTGPAASFTALVDDLSVSIVVERPDESLKINLAAAYALAGRTAEAEALFASLDGVASARHTLACALQREPEPSCEHIPVGQRIDDVIDLLLLDHLLHHPDDDPAPLAEAGIRGRALYLDRVIPALRCRVFAEPKYADICNDARRAPRYWIATFPGEEDRAERERQRAALHALPLPGFAAARAAIAADFERVLAANGVPASGPGR